VPGRRPSEAAVGTLETTVIVRFWVLDWRSPARVVLAIVTGMIHVPADGGVPEMFPLFAIESQAGAPLREKVSGSFAVERRVSLSVERRAVLLLFRGNPAA